MKTITIDNYDYQIKELNIFTGLNGVGKTNLIDKIRHHQDVKEYGSWIFDKPETNSHPKLISEWINNLCKEIQEGKYEHPVFIETHSDHIINGILVYCKRLFEQTGESFADKVSIYHLSKDKSNLINIDDDGKIDKQPEQFFDQIEKDTMSLMGFNLITTHVPIVQGYRIKRAPAGFFDQINIDQKYLVGF